MTANHRVLSLLNGDWVFILVDPVWEQRASSIFSSNSSRGRHSEKHRQKPLCELILLQSALDKNLRGPLFVKNQQELWSLFIQMRPFSCSKPGVAVFRQTRSSASHIRGWPAVRAPGTRCQRQLGRSKYTKGMQLPQSMD